MAKVTKVKAEIVPQTEVVKIEKENKPVIRKAEALLIKASDDETDAYTILKEIGSRVKFIESKRTAITKPLNASLKEVNALFKTLAAPLKTADVIIRNKILEFRTKREEAAEKRREKLEAKAEEAEEEGDEDTAIELAEKAEDVTANVGESVIQKRWAIRITDASKLPEKVLRELIDTEEGYEIMEKWLRKEMRNAPKGEDNKPLLDIPGTEIFQDKNVRI